jgi:DNA-binding IscR family transcriptional regulator
MNFDPQAWLHSANNAIWRPHTERLPFWRAVPLRLARLVLVLWRDLTSGQLTMRAMSLVYTTLLSLVPLLAVSFSVLKAFGVHNQAEPMLRNLLTPLGEEGLVVAARIVQFIQNVNVGVLGATGVAFLLFTVVSLMQKIEESFNFIWHVPRTRSTGERFSRYLSVLLVGPVLVFSAMGVTASVLNSEVVSRILAMPYFGSSAAFYAQHPGYLVAAAGDPQLSNRMRERLALAVMAMVAERHRTGAPPVTLEQLAADLAVPAHSIDITLHCLEQAGMVAQVRGVPPRYLPARDPSTVSVHALLQAVRSAGEDDYFKPETLPLPETVARVADQFERSVENAVANVSVSALAGEPEKLSPSESRIYRQRDAQVQAAEETAQTPALSAAGTVQRRPAD